MSNFVEIDIDFDYCGEVDMVLAHDESGEHEDVRYYRDCGECHVDNERDQLEAENIKLRELVKDMKAYICRMHHDEPCAAVCDAYDEMLGVCIW